MTKKYLLIAALLSFAGVNAEDAQKDKLIVQEKTISTVTTNNPATNEHKTVEKNENVNILHKTDLNLVKPTNEPTLKKPDSIKLVETTTTQPTEHHNWLKWLGLLALLGALLVFLSTTFRKRRYETEDNQHARKNRHSDKEVEFTFEEEKHDKGSDKRHYNKDYKNRD